jgi:hypothetical protein
MKEKNREESWTESEGWLKRASTDRKMADL